MLKVLGYIAAIYGIIFFYPFQESSYDASLLPASSVLTQSVGSCQRERCNCWKLAHMATFQSCGKYFWSNWSCPGKTRVVDCPTQLICYFWFCCSYVVRPTNQNTKAIQELPERDLSFFFFFELLDNDLLHDFLSKSLERDSILRLV